MRTSGPSRDEPAARATAGHEDAYFASVTLRLPSLEPEDDAFWDSVRSLPRRQAQAIALFYLEDLSVKQIGRILECSDVTVRVHLHKGRKRLADLLGGSHE